MRREDAAIEKSFDIKLLGRLYKYTKKVMPLLLISVVLLFAVTAADLARPYITKILIDDYIVSDTFYLESSPDGGFEIGGESYSITRDETDTYIEKGIFYSDAGRRTLSGDELTSLNEARFGGVIRLAVLVIILLVIALVFSYFQTVILNLAGQKVIYDIRSNLFEKIESLSLKFFEKNPIGRLVTRMTNDLNNINDLYTNVVVTFLKDVLIIIGSMVILFIMDYKLAFLSLSVIPILMVMTFIFRVQARKAYREVRRKLAVINATLSENITGMKIIQIFNREDKFSDEFKVINNAHLEASLKEVKIYAIYRPLMNLIYHLSIAIVILYGGYRVYGGSLEIGTIVAFMTYIKQLFRPIFDLAEKFNILQSAMASIERTFILMDEKVDIMNKDNPYTKDDTIGDIEFRNVDFEYNENEPILKDVSFSVKKGETVAFVGATGSGKTTIINLLMRMYDIKHGNIFVDGVDIRDYDKHFLRSRISPVLQDVFLFSGDIKGNISLLSPDIGDKEIKEASRYVNADKFIERLKTGYDAPVTEGGTTYSAGQRQLLSFARALVHKPDILILDEATANIDTETEILIQDAIEKLIKGRTTFVVAHRLSTIKNADKIIVMHKGRIKEMGTHEELLQNKDIYYDLYRLQYS